MRMCGARTSNLGAREGGARNRDGAGPGCWLHNAQTAGRSLGYTRSCPPARTVRTRRKLLLDIGQSRYSASPLLKNCSLSIAS